MDILGWIGWLFLKVLGLTWSVAWFLLGGWVVTLAQIAVIVGGIFLYKYGWQRAPIEMWSRASGFGRFAWSWLRAREMGHRETRIETRETVRIVRVKEPGDINVSTLLTLIMMLGLVLLAVAR